MRRQEELSALSTKDRLLAAALATGASHDDAAKAANVSGATITRRLHDPLFRREIEAARDRLIDRALGIASNSLADVFGVLVEIAMDPEMPPTPRVAAAGRIAELVLRFRDEQEIVRRVEQLELEFRARSGDPVSVGIIPTTFERAAS